MDQEIQLQIQGYKQKLLAIIFLKTVCPLVSLLLVVQTTMIYEYVDIFDCH